MSGPLHPESPLLDHCPEGLSADAYYSAEWWEAEQVKIWARNWVYVGRREAFPARTITRVAVAGENLIVVADGTGALTAFHNTCRHRGSELCEHSQQAFNGKLVSCPYHAWAYGVDGRLVSTGFGMPTEDFDKAAYGLFGVHLKEWNGFVYLCLAEVPPAFSPDMGLRALDNWPMQDLVIGHRLETELACNWKVFWENYNECLHCPGIHPELSERVPVYRKGIMSPQEAAGWTPDIPVQPVLEAGARTWTVSGRVCGPEFAGLSHAERENGHNFVTIYPTMYLVAHVDYVRAVSLAPMGPERTKLTAEWLFLPQTLEQAEFDLADVTDFATTVLAQDGAACEMNQRGLRSARFRAGRLMPQEFDLHRFHQWVLGQMDKA